MSHSDERFGDEEDSAETAGSRRGPGRPRKTAVERAVDDPRLATEREATEREIAEEIEFTDDERMQLFMDGSFQSILPDLPTFPGWHTCWLTTSNPHDTIPRRIQLGYQLIRVEECPGWHGVAPKSGDYQGIVAVNEMLAARIPTRLYRRMIAWVHHDEPLSQEEKLKNMVDQIKDSMGDQGAQVSVGDGSANVVQRARFLAEAFPT